MIFPSQLRTALTSRILHNFPNFLKGKSNNFNLQTNSNISALRSLGASYSPSTCHKADVELNRIGTENTNSLIFRNINNSWIWQQNEKLQLPILRKIDIIDFPNGSKWVPPTGDADKSSQSSIIEMPSHANADIVKEAVRMIIIRRKKMKKHKLKKLRKKMKFEWAKRRQRRELKKEKEFQAVLIKQCKEAEAFSAEKYVEERISKLNEIVIPRYWKGKRLPEFLIRQLMGLPPKSV